MTKTRRPSRQLDSLQPRHATPRRWHHTCLLGEGRATRVFRARPSNRGEDWPSDYVVKCGSPGVSAKLVRSLLRNEAAACSAAAGPHLPALLEADWGSDPYLVFPYFAGGALNGRIRRWGPAPPSLAFAILRQVLSALNVLHSAGYAHGDIKPANVMVAADNHATLIDLGFASQFSSAKKTSRFMLATPAYAATEIHDGGSPTPASDLYSLGVVAFELLTSKRPYVADDAPQLAAAHRSTPPPDVRSHAPHLSDTCARLIKRLMAKDQAERPSLRRTQQALLRLEVECFDQRSAPLRQAFATPLSIGHGATADRA